MSKSFSTRVKVVFTGDITPTYWTATTHTINREGTTYLYFRTTDDERVTIRLSSVNFYTTKEL